MEDIVSKAVATDDRLTIELNQYEYKETILTDKLDDAGQAKDSTEIDLMVHPGETNGFTIMAGKRGGGVVPSQDLSSMEKKAKESEQFQANFSLRRLAPRFEVQLLGHETVNGKEAYELAFQPKPDQPPAQERIEKILGQLQGKIWISTADYSILKTDATLAKPLRLAWVFATLEKLDFYYESQPLEPGTDSIQGPAKFNLSFQVGVVFSTIRQKQRVTMSDFKKIIPNPVTPSANQ